MLGRFGPNDELGDDKAARGGQGGGGVVELCSPELCAAVVGAQLRRALLFGALRPPHARARFTGSVLATVADAASGRWSRRSGVRFLPSRSGIPNLFSPPPALSPSSPPASDPATARAAVFWLRVSAWASRRCSGGAALVGSQLLGRQRPFLEWSRFFFFKKRPRYLPDLGLLIGQEYHEEIAYEYIVMYFQRWWKK